MDAVRRLFRRAVALALVAMLGLALAPTVSHALASQRVSAQPWIELCAVGGEPDAALRLAHCPLCVQPGHSPALPTAPQCVGAAFDGAHEAPAALPPGVVLSFVWLAPPSRAPPAVVAA